MTMPELKVLVAQQKSMGLEHLILQVPAKGPPRGETVTVSGFGRGIIYNVKETDTGFMIVAAFKVATIEKNIRAWDRKHSA